MLPSSQSETDGRDSPHSTEIPPSPAESTHLDRGKQFWSQGAYDRAIAEFSEALRTDAATVEAYLLRGEVRAAQGDRTRALEDFSEAIRLDFSRVLNCANR